jgi:hypothetical protein
MDVNEAQEVKQLREENARLKKLVADLSLPRSSLYALDRDPSDAQIPGNAVSRAFGLPVHSSPHVGMAHSNLPIQLSVA